MDSLTCVAPFPSTAVEVVGALDLAHGTNGARPRRLPAWTRAQMPTSNFDFVVSMTSGVRVSVVTRSSVLELVAEFIAINPRGLRPAPIIVDLVVDGVPRTRRTVDIGDATLIDPETYDVVRPAPPTVLRFGNLGDHEKRVEIWLPHTGAVELIELRSNEPVDRPLDGQPKWVHHGSSISQGGEAASPIQTWPVVAARQAGTTVLNLGFSGNAVGDPFVARTIRDLPARVISLEIGVNVVNGDLMRRRSFEPLLHGFLDTVREGHPETPVLLIGPIPCPSLESLPGPTIMQRGRAASAGDPRQLDSGGMSLGVVREAIASVLEHRIDRRLHYLDGRQLLTPAEVGDLDDGLHPNARALRRMGQRFAKLAWGPGGAFRDAP